jgi:hypothetical protein
MSPQESAADKIPKGNVSVSLATDPQRWQGATRPYAQEDVERLRGSFRIEYRSRVIPPPNINGKLEPATLTMSLK